MRWTKIFSQLCVFGLILTSAKVLLTLMLGSFAWTWIIAYWGILTAKNLIDFVGGFLKE